MERTRTVKRGYVVFGESITLRWGVELSWGNRALGTGKAGCGVRLAAVAAGFAGRAVVFFTLPAKVAPAILMHGRICLNWKPVSLFYHEFLLLHARHIAGGASVAFSAPSIPPSALPATLKPEPHQRDPYDWNARHEAVKKRNRTVKPEYVMIGGQHYPPLGRGAFRGRKKHGSGFLGEIIPSAYCDEYGLWI